MNLPNKLTISRIILAFIIIIILVFPFQSVGVEVPKIYVNEMMVMDVKYLFAGFLFIIAAITDLFDGHIARRKNLVTDLGKMNDAIADKILIDSVLIILASSGFIHPIIAVIIVVRDGIVNSIKMNVSTNGKLVKSVWTGKIKTACLIIGIALTLFYNIPFEFWNLKVADFLLVIACVLAITSGIEYYQLNKKNLISKND